MSNNYKLICKYAGDLPMTVGEEYPFENVSLGIRVKLNDGGHFLFYNIGTYRHDKYFDLVPVDATTEPIMVQPADYIDPKLLEVYNALDEKGKAIMREKMPDVKWPKVVRYLTWDDIVKNELGFSGSSEIVVEFPYNKYTPEINGGEIRFSVND